MALELKTEHPHIVKAKGIRGCRPIIKGTGIEVSLIGKLYKMGESVDEILSMYPHLTPSGIYDALSYCYENRRGVVSTPRARKPRPYRYFHYSW